MAVLPCPGFARGLWSSFHSTIPAGLSAPLCSISLSLFQKRVMNRRKRMGVVKASKLTAPTSNTTPWAGTSCLGPTIQEPSSTKTTGSAAKSQPQSAQPSVLGSKLLQGESQRYISAHSHLLSPLQSLDSKPWLGRMLEIQLPRDRIAFHRCFLPLP